MNVLHNIFPNFHDLSKEDNKNRDISGDYRDVSGSVC